MKKLRWMKKTLTDYIECQMCHLDTVDAKELGEAIDMIKDLSEAIYYCTITEAMEEKEPEYYRDAERKKGVMYYGGDANYYDRPYPMHKGNGYPHHEPRDEPHLMEIMRDHREGKSPMSRKMYMESKELHKEKTVMLQELEKYAQELTADIVEMIEEATPEEKQYLSNRIAALATKIK